MCRPSVQETTHTRRCVCGTLGTQDVPTHWENALKQVTDDEELAAAFMLGSTLGTRLATLPASHVVEPTIFDPPQIWIVTTTDILP